MKKIINRSLTKQTAEKYLQIIKKNNGNCPCRIPNMKCGKCNDFELQGENLLCYCGVFELIKQPEEVIDQ